MDDSSRQPNKIRTIRMKITRGWKKATCTLCQLFFHRIRKCRMSLKRCLCSPSLCPTPEAKKICRLKLKPPPVRPLRRVVSKLKRNPTNELERLKRKGDSWTANDLFRFQSGSLDNCDAEEKRAICMEWLKLLDRIPKKYCYLAWYASAIYSCYYRLAPLLVDKEEKKRIWTDVKREYAEIFLMGRRIWRRPTHPSRLRILYDLAMLCVRFNDVPNDDTVVLFRDLLHDHDNFNFEVLDEIEYAQSIAKTVRLENHIIDLFYQRRRSTASNRSSFHSRSGGETLGSSFRSLKMKSDAKSDGTQKTKLRKAVSLRASDDILPAEHEPRDRQLLTPGSPELIRKPSVRFAEKSEVTGNSVDAETGEMERSDTVRKISGQSPVDVVVKMSDKEPNIWDGIPAELDGHLVIPNIDVPPEISQNAAKPVIVSITTSLVTDFDKEFTIRKSPERAKTSQTLWCEARDKTAQSFPE